MFLDPLYKIIYFFSCNTFSWTNRTSPPFLAQYSLPFKRALYRKTTYCKEIVFQNQVLDWSLTVIYKKSPLLFWHCRLEGERGVWMPARIYFVKAIFLTFRESRRLPGYFVEKGAPNCPDDRCGGSKAIWAKTKQMGRQLQMCLPCFITFLSYEWTKNSLMMIVCANMEFVLGLWTTVWLPDTHISCRNYKMMCGQFWRGSPIMSFVFFCQNQFQNILSPCEPFFESRLWK